MGSDIAELGGKKNLSKGIHIAVEEESIRVDVSLLIKYGYTIIDVAKEVQNAVYSAMRTPAADGGVCQRPCAGRCLRPGWKKAQ
ncbi:MAG: Asp23/Gls24 family envelope stress response protein [Dysosmobacter welbionis]